MYYFRIQCHSLFTLLVPIDKRANLDTWYLRPTIRTWLHPCRLARAAAWKDTDARAWVSDTTGLRVDGRREVVLWNWQEVRDVRGIWPDEKLPSSAKLHQWNRPSCNQQNPLARLFFSRSCLTFSFIQFLKGNGSDTSFLIAKWVVARFWWLCISLITDRWIVCSWHKRWKEINCRNCHNFFIVRLFGRHCFD